MANTDFHFLAGHFRVRHERLAVRLAGSTEWESFEAELWGYPVMGGAAFVDETKGDLGGREFWGMTLRIHDPTTDEWALYWADTGHSGLCPPVRGRLEGSGGIFFGKDIEQGQPVAVRFTWSRTDTALPRWEQAFSIDRGASWETNWVMEFERISDPPISPSGKGGS